MQARSTFAGLPCTLVCIALLALGAIAHIGYLLGPSPLDLSGDEAHYWDWSRRPLELSYYCKGPLVAYILAGSRAVLADWSQRMVGSEALAVRLPAIALSIITGIGIYVLALSTLRRPRLALAALALTFTIPVMAVGAIVMTIDAPLACAWVWSLVCLDRALRRDSLWAWILAGVLIALGILAKYTMLLMFPTVGLLLLTQPRLRRLLARPGPYVATAIGFLGFVPILIWNSQNQWMTFRHVGGQTGLSGGAGFDLAGIWTYLAGQLGVSGIIWLPLMIWAVMDLWRKPLEPEAENHDPISIKLLLYATLTNWLVFLGFSTITKIEPNWPVMALITGDIVLVLWLSRRLRAPAASIRLQTRSVIAAGMVLGGAMVLIMHRTEWLMPLFAQLTRDAPPWELTPIARYDPTVRLRGWPELGVGVGEVLAAERAAGRDPFILADDYQVASELAFYTPGQPRVYSAQSVLGGRNSQYDVWTNPIRDPASFVGRPCVYVGSLKPELKNGGPNGAEPLPGLRKVKTITYTISGQNLHVWTIYVCGAYAGFDPSRAGATQKF